MNTCARSSSYSIIKNLYHYIVQNPRIASVLWLKNRVLLIKKKEKEHKLIKCYENKIKKWRRKQENFKNGPYGVD
jgi:hypothetical protein